jgi:glutamine---fructose-6-phosphate transaminase (isomerizing)
MKPNDERYTRYALCREMLDVVEVVRGFDPTRTERVAATIGQAGRLMLTGEGSSRIFPAKNMIRRLLTDGVKLHAVTEGSRQAATYDLKDFAVFAASNSGRTKEVVLLLKTLAQQGNPKLFGLSAKADNLLAEHTAETFVLNCGWEEAVAATKSVVEQALVYQSLAAQLAAKPMTTEQLGALAEAIQNSLTRAIDPAIVEAACKAGTIYFAGYNDGVAEELTLKTNEITRKKSDFLEGTYAVHGIEEVMDPADVVFVIEPIAEEIPKFKEVLVEGVGCRVVCIATEPVEGFETLQVPSAGPLTPHVFLAAGWSLLVEIGLALGIDLDKPERARKVGNEFQG